MEKNEKLADVLNDLIQINNDRVRGYEKAAGEVKKEDLDLKATFLSMADESRRFVADLTRRVRSLGKEPAEDSTVSGKIYRVWMDVKNTFADGDRHSVLEACEFGEDAAQKAYTAALASDETMNSDIRQLIVDQQLSLKMAHDLIKQYRDVHEAVS